MSADELLEWEAYSCCEPFGSPVEDERARISSQLFYSANSQKGTPVPDFFDRDPEETARARAILEADQLEDNLESFFNARVEPSE
jgi:hypothetical protein